MPELPLACPVAGAGAGSTPAVQNDEPAPAATPPASPPT